jgi:hypothetical protein
MSARAALPVALNEPVAAILGAQGTDGGIPSADRAQTVAGLIVVLSLAQRCNAQGFDLAGDARWAHMRQGDLPKFQAGAQTGLSAVGGQAETDGSSNMMAESQNSKLLRIYSGLSCETLADVLSVSYRVSAGLLGFAAHYASD